MVAARRIRVQGITPFLWFKDQAEPAVRFYTSIFPRSKITALMPGEPARKGAKPTVMGVQFTLDGREFFALNGGPTYRLSPAFSLFVQCASQREVDALWTRLVRGGTPSRCGWLVDRFGLSWQIIPSRLTELLGDPDPGRAGRAMEAMLKMGKINVAALERAADSTG